MGIEELSKIHAVIIYSTTGTRIISQYYTSAVSPSSANAFEADLLQSGLEDQLGQVMQHDGFIVVYKLVADFLMFVVCDMKANEILIGELLESLATALSLIYKGKVNTDELVKQIDLLYLVLDETIENGFIFEVDPEVVAARTLLKQDHALLGKATRVSSF
jgi:hypothetical protein